MSDSGSNQTQEQLRFLYDKSLQLLLSEVTLVSERTNIFLLFNTILFAAFVILEFQSNISNEWTKTISLVASIVGLIFCGFSHILIKQANNAADRWRDKMIKIENNPIFWTGIDNPKDFKIIEQHPKQGFCWPPNILGIYLPVLIGVLWIFALVWTVSNITNMV